MSIVELEKKCAKLFGINRLGQRVTRIIEENIQTTIDRGFAKRENDRIFLGKS